LIDYSITANEQYFSYVQYDIKLTNIKKDFTEIMEGYDNRGATT